MTSLRTQLAVIDPVSDRMIDLLQTIGEVVYRPYPSSEELYDLLKACHVLVLRSGTVITAQHLDSAPQLRLIARAGNGLDNIPVEEAQLRGIAVINCPAQSSRSVAELALGLTLALSRQIIPGQNSVREGKWLKGSLFGSELFGKTAGLIGFGKIGKEIAKLYQALGIQTFAYRHRTDPEALLECETYEAPYLPLEQLLATSDIITLQVPLTAETYKMISDSQFQMMKRRPLLINIARWDVIDQAALLHALESDQLSGVAIDPTELHKLDARLLTHPNVILTPHLGGNTHESQERIANQMFRKIKHYLQERGVTET